MAAEASRRRSRVVPLGTVAALSAALLAGCGQDEATAYCVTGPDNVVVEQDRCDGSDNSTYIVYSSSYPARYRPGDRIPHNVVGTRVSSVDANSRAAHGFARSGGIPARGGFGTHGGGSGG